MLAREGTGNKEDYRIHQRLGTMNVLTYFMASIQQFLTYFSLDKEG